MKRKKTLAIAEFETGVELTPLQISAMMFVKTQSDHIDAKNGNPPQRETQKRVAGVVRETFFDKQKKPRSD